MKDRSKNLALIGDQAAFALWSAESHERVAAECRAHLTVVVDRLWKLSNSEDARLRRERDTARRALVRLTLRLAPPQRSRR